MVVSVRGDSSWGTVESAVVESSPPLEVEPSGDGLLSLGSPNTHSVSVVTIRVAAGGAPPPPDPSNAWGHAHAHYHRLEECYLYDHALLRCREGT